MEIPEGILDVFHEISSKESDAYTISRAPGRVEVLGNHVDYNGGMVLAATIDRFVWSIGTTSENVTIHSMDFNETTSFKIDDLQPTLDPKWFSYGQGVYWAFKRRNYQVKGLIAAIKGDVPIGGGLSSSAALEVSLTNLIANLSCLRIHPKALAMIAFEAERLFCNISCGIMDQFTSQLGRSNSLLEIFCSTMKTQDVALPENVRFVIVDSKVSRQAGDALNKRRTESQQALSLLVKEGWDVGNLSGIALSELDNVEQHLNDILAKRVRHIITENTRVERGVQAVKSNNVKEFGTLMYESHDSSRDLYEVSHPSLDLLVELSRGIPGVMGCRMSGAGFGGSVITLVKEDTLMDYSEEIKTSYERESGVTPSVYPVIIPGGVTIKSHPRE